MKFNIIYVPIAPCETNLQGIFTITNQQITTRDGTYKVADHQDKMEIQPLDHQLSGHTWCCSFLSDQLPSWVRRPFWQETFVTGVIGTIQIIIAEFYLAVSCPSIDPFHSRHFYHVRKNPNVINKIYHDYIPFIWSSFRLCEIILHGDRSMSVMCKAHLSVS